MAFNHKPSTYSLGVELDLIQKWGNRVEEIPYVPYVSRKVGRCCVMYAPIMGIWVGTPSSEMAGTSTVALCPVIFWPLILPSVGLKPTPSRYRNLRSLTWFQLNHTLHPKMYKKICIFFYSRHVNHWSYKCTYSFLNPQQLCTGHTVLYIIIQCTVNWKVQLLYIHRCVYFLHCQHSFQMVQLFYSQLSFKHCQ